MSYFAILLLAGCGGSGSNANGDLSAPITSTPVPLAGPNVFSFNDQTGATLSTLITSNTVVLTGSFSGLTASCSYGCTAIQRNGGAWSSAPVSGFKNGDSIAIRAISSSQLNTTIQATVTIGSTNSDMWQLTTVSSDACAGSPSPGQLCADGTVYAGVSPDGNVRMFTTRCDGGHAWNGASCVASGGNMSWSANNTVLTGVSSVTQGRANTASLVSLNGNADGPYTLASYCDALQLNGKNDWYLPALSELNILYSNKSSIGNFQSNSYWSSTEYDSAFSMGLDFGTGTNVQLIKSFPYISRCVRRN